MPTEWVRLNPEHVNLHPVLGTILPIPKRYQAQKSPTGERLEHVRAQQVSHRGARIPLRAFWLRLGEKLPKKDVVEWVSPVNGKGSISYSAVKNYHDETGQRTASLPYLARVGEVFDVNLEWLVTGQGPLHPTSEAVQQLVTPDSVIRDQVDAALASAFPPYLRSSLFVRGAVDEAIKRRVVELWGRGDVDLDRWLLVAEEIGGALRMPLEVVQPRKLQSEFTNLDSYIFAMTHAFLTVLPTEEESARTHELFKALGGLPGITAALERSDDSKGE